ncbi:MAG: hypothetical protein OXG47_08565 [bacterium]|nr:hypothetical protein [bacterium]
MYPSESGLLAELMSHVPDIWGENASSAVEVHCHDQAHMDLLITCEGTVIAVEAKLSHWSRVLAQAYLHRYCADYVYVAIPAHNVTATKLHDAKRFGIGVVGVSNRATRIVQPAIQAQPEARIRERLLAFGYRTSCSEGNL